MERLDDPRLLERIAGPGEPTLIGRGGSQLVYKYPGMPELVKVDYATLSMPAINGNILQATTPVKKNEPHIEAMLALRAAIKHTAESCLGKESFLKDRVSFVPFALSGRMCRELWGSTPYPDNQVRWFRTFVTVQEEAQPLVHPKEYGTIPLLATTYEQSAQKRIDPATYGTAMRRWVTCTDQTPWHDDDWDTLARLDGEQMGNYRYYIQRPAFRYALRRFVVGSIAFSNITGQHIDIGGADNVVLYRDGDAVRYLNVDPLIPLVDDALSYVNAGIYAGGNGQTISNEAAKWMLNTFGCIRSTNALAQALDLPDRIRVTNNRHSFVDNVAWSNIFNATQSVHFRGHTFPRQQVQPAAAPSPHGLTVFQK